MFGVIGNSMVRAGLADLSALGDVSCDHGLQNAIAEIAPLEIEPSLSAATGMPQRSFPPLEFDLSLSRPSLWGSPKKYFNLPPLVANTTLMPSSGTEIEFGFDKNFELPSLGEFYSLRQSGQWFARYTLWPTNGESDNTNNPLSVPTLPESLKDFLNPEENLENPVKANHSEGRDYCYSGHSSGRNFVKPSPVCVEDTIVAETPVFQSQAFEPTPLVVEAREIPDEPPVLFDLVEEVPKSIPQDVSVSPRVLLVTPHREVDVFVEEDLTGSTLAFVPADKLATGLSFYFSGLLAPFARAETESSRDIFVPGIMPVDVETYFVPHFEITSMTADDTRAVMPGVFWQNVSHLSTVSYLVQEDQPVFFKEDRDCGLCATSSFAKGAALFQVFGNATARSQDREVYLHSGMMFFQMGNQSPLDSRREEVLFMQQASRRLNTVSQNASKDQGDQNPNSRAREIYQIALDGDFDAA